MQHFGEYEKKVRFCRIGPIGVDTHRIPRWPKFRSLPINNGDILWWTWGAKLFNHVFVQSNFDDLYNYISLVIYLDITLCFETGRNKFVTYTYGRYSSGQKKVDL